MCEDGKISKKYEKFQKFLIDVENFLEPKHEMQPR